MKLKLELGPPVAYLIRAIARKSAAIIAASTGTLPGTRNFQTATAVAAIMIMRAANSQFSRTGTTPPSSTESVQATRNKIRIEPCLTSGLSIDGLAGLVMDALEIVTSCGRLFGCRISR